NDHRTVLAAGLDPFGSVEPETGHLLLRAVALDAVLDQHRADLRLEEFDLLGRRLPRRRVGGGDDGPGQDEERTEREAPHRQTASREDIGTTPARAGRGGE